MRILRTCWEWTIWILWAVFVLPFLLMAAAFMLLVRKSPSPFRTRWSLLDNDDPNSLLWRAWEDPQIREKYHLRRAEMAIAFTYLFVVVLWATILSLIGSVWIGFMGVLTGCIILLLPVTAFLAFVTDPRGLSKVEKKIQRAYLKQLDS